MRTFIAIPLPRDCQLLLDKMQQCLRVHDAEVRWVAIPSIHLTLKFLGEVASEVIPKLAEAMAATTAHEKPFELKLKSFGCFPNTRNPRVLWCGIVGETERLAHLQRQVETACAGMGFPPEDRDFRPHLTLGRIQGRRNLQPLLDRIKIGSDLECGFCADHFNIYRSVLKPQGAEYTVLHSIALNLQT